MLLTTSVCVGDNEKNQHVEKQQESKNAKAVLFNCLLENLFANNVHLPQIKQLYVFLLYEWIA